MSLSEHVGRIAMFIEGIAGSRGLRAALVTGEGAGCGIVDEMLERAVDPGVMVMRVKLSPEVSISLPGSVARNPSCRLGEPEAATDAGTALCCLSVTLRRICRLHPTLLVVDDLHAMSREQLADFAQFLASLADETFSILCRSTSVDPVLRCIVERYLLEEVDLGESGDAGAPDACRSSTGIAQDRVEHLPGAIPHRPAYATSAVVVRRKVMRLPIDIEGSERAMPDAGRKVEISMLGEITVRSADGSVFAVRGGRLRTVLGVLVIDRIVGNRLSYREFCRLAAGDVDDHMRARKTMLMGIRRLEDLLGPDTIIRDGETPRLNLEKVSVDLLQVHEIVRNAVSAARSGPLMRAVGQLNRALDMVEGAVLFPGLEGEMFTAAREDFNGSLRSAIIELSWLLLEEGELEGIAALLQRAAVILPGDEEIIGLVAEMSRRVAVA